MTENTNDSLLKELLEVDQLTARYQVAMAEVLVRICTANGSGKPTLLKELGYNDLRELVEKKLNCGFETVDTCLQVGEFVKRQGLDSKTVSKIGFSKLQIIASFAELGWLDNEDVPVAINSCKGRTDTELKNWLWERKHAKDVDKKIPTITEGDYSEPDVSIDSAFFLEKNQDEIPMMILLKQIERVYGKENVIRCLTEEMYKGYNFPRDNYRKSDQGMSRGGSFSSGKSPRSGKSQQQQDRPPKRPFRKKIY